MRYTLLILLAILMLTGCTLSPTGAVITEDDTVTVRMPIPFAESTQSPFYVAVDKGYYKEEGLTVEILQGTAELNPVKMVAAGADTFGVVGGPDLILTAQSKGLPIVAISLIHYDGDFPVLAIRKSTNITTLKELEGQEVGFFYGHISTDVLRSMFAAANVSIVEVNIPGFDYTQLFTGRIDSQYAWGPKEATLQRKGNTALHIIKPSDYNITVHGYTVFTTEDFIQANPDTVSKFLRATIKGISYTITNPKETITNHVLTRDENLDFQQQYEKLLITSAKYSQPLGVINASIMQTTHDRLRRLNVIENNLNISKTFTSDFLK